MGWVALDACVLILILVTVRTLVYIALRYKTLAQVMLWQPRRRASSLASAVGHVSCRQCCEVAFRNCGGTIGLTLPQWRAVLQTLTLWKR